MVRTPPPGRSPSTLMKPSMPLGLKSVNFSRIRAKLGRQLRVELVKRLDESLRPVGLIIRNRVVKPEQRLVQGLDLTVIGQAEELNCGDKRRERHRLVLGGAVIEVV